MFGVCKQTVLNWISRGVLEEVTVPGLQRTFISAKSVNNVLSEADRIVDLEKTLRDYISLLETTEKVYKQKLDKVRERDNLGKILTGKKLQFLELLQACLSVFSDSIDISEREIKILSFCLQGENHAEIAQMFDLTVSKVTKIVDKCIEAIKNIHSYQVLKIANESLQNELDVFRIENKRLNKENEGYQQFFSSNRAFFDRFGIDAPLSEEGNRHLYLIKVEQCKLSVRAMNCLKGAGIETIGELLSYSRNDLRRARGTGNVVIEEVETFLATMNLELKK